MTNHIHLLVTPPDDVAGSDMMYEVGRRYVPYFNRRHGRTGTLWEGRFRSCLVESREYVLNCYRYIERNPVRAGMVQDASAFPWSSHAGNTGCREDPLLLEHAEFTALAENSLERRRAYREFSAPTDTVEFLAAIRDATNTGVPLVSDSLKQRLASKGVRVERGKPGPRPRPADVASADLHV